jgi:hypothetical protein
LPEKAGKQGEFRARERNLKNLSTHCCSVISAISWNACCGLEIRCSIRLSYRRIFTVPTRN